MGKGNNMEKAKFGDWVEEWSEVANRNVYINSVTNECRWAMPDEVRFYLPPKMQDKLLQVFDYGHIESFKRQFSQVDVDSSGDISDVEIKMLFDAMGIDVSERKFKKLVRSIDLNGNGIIEFDEFCFMMYCILGNDKSGEWKDILPKATKKKDGHNGESKEGYEDFASENHEEQEVVIDDEVSAFTAEHEIGISQVHADTLNMISRAIAGITERNRRDEEGYSDTESSVSNAELDSLTTATGKYGHVV